MKLFKIIILTIILTLFTWVDVSFAIGKGGFTYEQRGYFFGDATVPFEAMDITREKMPSYRVYLNKEEIKERDIKIKDLKRGESYRTNFFKFIEWGDAGINKACEDGFIRKIHFIEIEREKISIPFLPFIPIYLNRYVTVVYGE